MTTIEEVAREPDTREQLQRGVAFLRRAMRFWHIPLLALLLGAVAFAGFMLVRKAKYRSETVILYIERGGAGNAESSQAERSASARLRELLLSRPRLERVVGAFDLYPELKQRYGMGDAIEELKKHVDFRAPGGDTFSIAFVGTSPSEAQRVTSELARSVIDGDSELRKQQAKVTLDFLTGEKRSSETQLRDAEQKLAAFMAQHPRFALDTTPLANGAAIRASLGGAPARPVQPGAQPQVIWAPGPAAGSGQAAAKRLTGDGGPVVAVPAPAASNAEGAQARAALAAAREHLTEQLSRYTPAHPDVRAAEAAVARASERLATLTSGTPPVAPSAPAAAAAAAPSAPAVATRSAVAAATARPRTLAAPAPVTGAAAGENLVDLETQWLQLTRSVTEARLRQDQIEAQLFRAGIQVGSEAVGHGVHVSVIDPAYLPERAEPPGRTTIGLIFASVALALGALLAMILAALDERMFTSRDAGGVATILAEVPSRYPRRAHVAA